jgi:hypothetical protein
MEEEDVDLVHEWKLHIRPACCHPPSDSIAHHCTVLRGTVTPPCTLSPRKYRTSLLIHCRPTIFSRFSRRHSTHWVSPNFEAQFDSRGRSP